VIAAYVVMATTIDSLELHAGPYPVGVSVTASLQNRDRLTTALRPILAIPHAVLVGPAGWVRPFGAAGLLGSAAYVLAIVNWFSLLLNREELKGVRDFQLYYLRWRTRSLAYMALLADDYPPFGDGPYPVSIEVTAPPTARDRVTIAVRPILAVPHLVMLFFILLAWLVATVVAWFSIVFTGSYPAVFWTFAIGAMRWMLRVEAYMLLLVDEYPPFSLE
jgi:hypothetical protein